MNYFGRFRSFVDHAGERGFSEKCEDILCELMLQWIAITPSRLANVRGCGTRNAWKTLWVHLPGSTRWLRADRCRDA